jgi:hypothetical protein
MGLTMPSKVELLYSVSPDVFKPDIEVQGKLAQLGLNIAKLSYAATC